MPKSSLWDDKDAYMHIKETITIPNTETAAALVETKNISKMRSIYWLHQWNKQCTSR